MFNDGGLLSTLQKKHLFYKKPVKVNRLSIGCTDAEDYPLKYLFIHPKQAPQVETEYRIVGAAIILVPKLNIPF